MNILLMNQFFWPDSAATSQLMTDLARGLADEGHEVHVICAQSAYAVEASSKAPRVHVHRIQATRFSRSVLGRMFSYASFYVAAAFRGFAISRPDIVVTLTTPPLLSLIGTALKTFRKSRHFIWEMDVYPDVAVDLGYFKPHGFIQWAVGLLADFSRRRSDGILALGPCMKTRLMGRGIEGNKIHVAENWADGSVVTPAAWPKEEKLVVLYSGNLGLGHDIETICHSMQTLKNDGRYRFVFAGGGAQRTALQQFCSSEEIKAVEFRPYSQLSSLGESLGSGHIGLVTQKRSCLGSLVPSKVYGILAAGRPVLYIGPAESTIGQLVSEAGCGWQVECGQDEQLTTLLQWLANNPDQVQQAGHKAREVFLSKYDLRQSVARICELIGASRAQSGIHILEKSASMAAGR